MMNPRDRQRNILLIKLNILYLRGLTYQELLDHIPSTFLKEQAQLLHSVHLKQKKRLRRSLVMRKSIAALGCIYIPTIITIKLTYHLKLQYGLGLLIPLSLWLIIDTIKLIKRIKISAISFQNIQTFNSDH